MKTHSTILVLVLLAAAVSAGRGADSDTRRLDKRIVVTGDTRAGPEGKARDPVTFLGVAVTPADPALAAQLRLPEGQGLVVTMVEDDSPAAKAGLKQHDVLRKLEDQILIDPRQLSVLVRTRKEGETVAVTYVRAGAEARATVKLAAHVPSPEGTFKWLGAETPDFLFRTENFNRSFNGGAPEAGDERGFPPNLRLAPGVPIPPMAGTAGANRVMIYRPETNVVFSDDEGTLVLRFDGKGQALTAKDLKGEVVFDGPVATPEQREALPEDLRKRFEKLEGMNVFAVPAPPPMPPPGFAPGIPANEAPLL